MARTGNVYQKTDLAILWFLNTTRYWRRMILACFICKMAFNNRLERENFCDNCIYKRAKAKQVPKFDGYDITARLGMMYKYTIEYSNFLFSRERERLLAANPTRTSQLMVERTLRCKTVLNNFVYWTWPDDGFADLKFPIPWRQQLAKAAMQIKTVEQLQKELYLICHLFFSSLHICANTIINLVITFVKIRPPLPPAEPPPSSQAQSFCVFQLKTSSVQSHPLLAEGPVKTATSPLPAATLTKALSWVT